MTPIIHINYGWFMLCCVRAQSIPCIHWGHFEGTEVMWGHFEGTEGTRVIKTESTPHAQSHTALDAQVSHYSHLFLLCLLTLSSALRKWTQEVKRLHVRI